MNLPNRLTVSRLGLTLLFVGVLSVESSWKYTAALLLFGAASFTDYLDGMLARRWNLVTNFGSLMDPLADKVLTSAAFVMFVQEKHLAAWVVVLVLTREFLVTGIRLIAMERGAVLAAERLGKHKTIWQLICALYFLFELASRERLFAWMAPLFSHRWLGVQCLGQVIVFLMAALTIISGLGYFIKNRHLFVHT